MAKVDLFSAIDLSATAERRDSGLRLRETDYYKTHTPANTYRSR
jgi:hypothetical protein